jgi:hypothetical protein
VKPMACVAAILSRSGARRNPTVAPAATPASSPRATGTGEPSGRRLALPFAAIAVFGTLILGVALANAVAPTVSVKDATNVEYTTAQLEGEVDPQGQSTAWKFQYATEADFSNAQDGPSGSTETAEPVSGALTGLKPGTTYHLRLLAENSDSAGSPSEDVATDTFATKAVTPPSVDSIDAVTIFTNSTAHFSAHLSPNAPTGPLSPAAQAAYRTSWHFQCEPGCGGTLSGEILADQGSHEFPGGSIAVTGDASGLQPHTQYTVKLIAENAGGRDEEAAPAFSTAAVPPILTLESPSARGGAVITVQGTVNPGNSPLIECHFTYSIDQSYSQSAPCEPNPTGASRVHADLTGLAPSTIYHYRLEADNGVGPAVFTPGASFESFAAASTETCSNETIRTEQHSAFLPDCRAYEQVSPADKNGGDVIAYAPRTRASADGEALQFASLQGFSDARGSGVSFEYLAQRGAGGWSTHAITPALPTQSFKTLPFGDAFYDGEFSADLNDGVFSAARPLAGTPDAVSKAVNIYLRDDLHTPGPGHYQLLTPCPACYSARLSVDATGGQFSLGFRSDQTATIPYDASAEAIQAALEALPAVGAGNVIASAAEGSVDILFSGALSAHTEIEAKALVTELGASSTSLTGATATATITLAEQPLPPLPSGNVSSIAVLSPSFAAASPDFARVLFESIQNLTAEAAPQPPLCGKENFFFPFPSLVFCRPQLYEWDHGALRLVGILPGGDAADISIAGQGAHNNTSLPHVISDGSDGHSRIFFTQPTDAEGHTVAESEEIGLNLGGSEGNLFMRVDHTSTIQLNASESSAPSSFSPARYLDASADGHRVFFFTYQALTDDAPSNDLKTYVYDVVPDSNGHHLTFISREARGLFGLSQDGHSAYLASEHIELWHDGALTPFGSFVFSEDELLDFVGLPGKYNFYLRQSRVAPDGRHLIYSRSTEYPTGSCQSGCLEVYVYSAENGRLACASCSPAGDPATANAEVATEGFHGGARVTSSQTRAFPANGRYVFFTSPDRLLSRDTNGKKDAYEYDTLTGQLSLLSTGTSKSDSWYLDTSADGRDAFIITNQPLVSTDTDKNYDVYDVRIGGGYPEPPSKPVICAGETCQGAQTPTPPPAPVGSQNEIQDVKPPRVPCPKGKHAVRSHGIVRCLRSKHRRSHRRADFTPGGAG